MSKSLLDDLGVDTLGQHQTGMRVSSVVEADVIEPGTPGDPFERPRQSVGL